MLESVDSPSPSRHLREQFATELNKIIVIIASRFIARKHLDPEWRSDALEALVVFADEDDLCAFDEVLRTASDSGAVADAFFALFVSILKGRLYLLAVNLVALNGRLAHVEKTKSLEDLREQFDSILPAAGLVFSEWAERTLIWYQGSSVKSTYVAKIQEVLDLAFTRYLDRRAFASTQPPPDGLTDSGIEAEPITPSKGVGHRPKTQEQKTAETSRRNRELRTHAGKLRAKGLSISETARELANTDPYRGMKAGTIRRIIASAVR
jgi:hypothetical protein